jgi:hypothetical protein
VRETRCLRFGSARVGCRVCVVYMGSTLGPDLLLCIRGVHRVNVVVWILDTMSYLSLVAIVEQP